MVEKGFFEGIHWGVGPFDVTGSIVITWILTVLIVLASWAWVRFSRGSLGPGRMLLEALFEALEGGVEGVLGPRAREVFPFIATLWVFIFVSNMIGLVPGFKSPTSDLSVTSALAFLVFLSVHWYGVRLEGWRGYLGHYLSPNPILLPFHLVSEVSRTLALAVRLFGNMMSLELTAVLVLMVAGLLVPVPLLMLHIVEAVIQSYIFGMLALVYIAGALRARDAQRRGTEA
jgi:F-type H+-transporting ATPase subunit a